jgi:DNA-binding NarL/FixJ family response regulator
MKDLILLANDLIRIESELDLSLPCDAQLAILRTRVAEFINSAETTSPCRAEAYELLSAIHQLQQAGLETALAHQLSTLSEIRNSIEELSELSPRELIGATPARACHDLSLGRVMISTISGSIWLPQHLHIEERGAESVAFEEFVDGAHIPLSDAPLETELIRRRTAAFVPNPASDKRTYKQIVDVARTRAYLAAPITLRGRTIGILHADRPDDPDSLSRDDRELLATFAECVSTLLESAVLQDRMERQIKHATEAYGQVVSMLEDVDGSPARAPQVPARARASTWYPGPALRGTSSLTSREREVLVHLATGATNAQIARNLVVSEATVKSHLKQISKKLGTSSRAAAVAAYARMSQPLCGIAQ